jgi:hypothetical protein
MLEIQDDVSQHDYHDDGTELMESINFCNTWHNPIVNEPVEQYDILSEEEYKVNVLIYAILQHIPDRCSNAIFSFFVTIPPYERHQKVLEIICKKYGIREEIISFIKDTLVPGQLEPLGSFEQDMNEFVESLN